MKTVEIKGCVTPTQNGHSYYKDCPFCSISQGFFVCTAGAKLKTTQVYTTAPPDCPLREGLILKIKENENI